MTENLERRRDRNPTYWYELMVRYALNYCWDIQELSYAFLSTPCFICVWSLRRLDLEVCH